MTQEQRRLAEERAKRLVFFLAEPTLPRLGEPGTFDYLRKTECVLLLYSLCGGHFRALRFVCRMVCRTAKERLLRRTSVARWWAKRQLKKELTADMAFGRTRRNSPPEC